MPSQDSTGGALSGLAAALFALAMTLDKKKVISLEDYRDTLVGLWDGMPEEDAGSGTGFVFERLLDLLNEVIAQRTPGARG
jgi:hypothetical protein